MTFQTHFKVNRVWRSTLHLVAMATKIYVQSYRVRVPFKASQTDSYCNFEFILLRRGKLNSNFCKVGMHGADIHGLRGQGLKENLNVEFAIQHLYVCVSHGNPGVLQLCPHLSPRRFGRGFAFWSYTEVCLVSRKLGGEGYQITAKTRNYDQKILDFLWSSAECVIFNTHIEVEI